MFGDILSDEAGDAHRFYRQCWPRQVWEGKVVANTSPFMAALPISQARTRPNPIAHHRIGCYDAFGISFNLQKEADDIESAIEKSS